MRIVSTLMGESFFQNPRSGFYQRRLLHRQRNRGGSVRGSGSLYFSLVASKVTGIGGGADRCVGGWTASPPPPQPRHPWLPDGYSQIFRSYVFCPSGFWTMAPLRCAAKFDPFLSLDCARVEGMGAQSKERRGSNFAIWQH